MARIPKKRRAEVRAAREPRAPASKKRRESFGIQVTDDGSSEELFRLFAENKRRLGSPSLPLAWFEGLREEFGREAVIHRAVEPSGRTIAAVMSFTYGKVLPTEQFDADGQLTGPVTDPSNWSAWPISMILVGIVGFGLATRVWNAKPKGKKAAGH